MNDVLYQNDVVFILLDPSQINGSFFSSRFKTSSLVVPIVVEVCMDSREKLLRNSVRNSQWESCRHYKVTSQEEFDSPIWSTSNPPIIIIVPTKISSGMTKGMLSYSMSFLPRQDKLRWMLKGYENEASFKPTLNQQNDYLYDLHWLKPQEKYGLDESEMKSLNIFDEVFSPSIFIQKVDLSKKRDIYNNFSKVQLLESHKVNDLLQKCRDIKKQMIDNKKRALEDLEKVIDDQINKFNDEILQRYLKRKQILDGFNIEMFEKKLRQCDIKPRSTPAPLTKIILKCSDVFRIIFSFLETKEIILQILPTSSYFYSYVRRNIPLDVCVKLEQIERTPFETFLSKFRISKFRLGLAFPNYMLSTYLRKRIYSPEKLLGFFKTCSRQHLKSIEINELERVIIGDKIPLPKDEDIWDFKKNQRDERRRKIHQVYDEIKRFTHLQSLNTSVLPDDLNNLTFLKKLVYPINFHSLGESSIGGGGRRNVEIKHFSYRCSSDIEVLIRYLDHQRRPNLEEISFVRPDLIDYSKGNHNQSENDDILYHEKCMRRLNDRICKKCPNLCLFETRLFFDFETMSMEFLEFVSSVDNVLLVYNGGHITHHFNYVGQVMIQEDEEFLEEDGKWINVEEEVDVVETKNQNNERKKLEGSQIYPKIEIVGGPKKDSDCVNNYNTTSEKEGEKETEGNKNTENEQHHHIGTITPPQNIVNIRKSHLIGTTSESFPSDEPLIMPFEERVGSDETETEEHLQPRKTFEKIRFLSTCLERNRIMRRGKEWRRRMKRQKNNHVEFIIYDRSRNRNNLNLDQGWNDLNAPIDEDESPDGKFMKSIFSNIPYITYKVCLGQDRVVNITDDEDRRSTLLIEVINNLNFTSLSTEGLALEFGFRSGVGCVGDIYYNLENQEEQPLEESDLLPVISQNFFRTMREKVVRKGGLKKLELKITYMDRGAMGENDGRYYSENYEEEENDMFRHLEREFCGVPKVVMDVMREGKHQTSIEKLVLDLDFSADCFVQIRDLKILIYDHILKYLKEFGKMEVKNDESAGGLERKCFEVKIRVEEILIGGVVSQEGRKEKEERGRARKKMVVRPEDRDGTEVKKLVWEVNRDVRDFLFNQKNFHDWFRVSFKIVIGKKTSLRYGEVSVVYEREKN